MEDANGWAMCRIGFVETVRGVAMARGRRALRRLYQDWLSINVVEVDAALAEEAAELALSSELRSLDALHLAAALLLPRAGLTVATWDRRLHDAAASHGLRVFPPSLP